MNEEKLVARIYEGLKILAEPMTKAERDEWMAQTSVLSAALSALSAHRQAVALEKLVACVSMSGEYFDIRVFNSDWRG